MTDFRQKIWTKLYYKTRLSNSREDSKRVANEAVEDFDKMFSDSTQTLKQAFEKLPQGNKMTFTPVIPFEDDLSQFMTEKQVLDAIFKRLKESTIFGINSFIWCISGIEIFFNFDCNGKAESIETNKRQ